MDLLLYYILRRSFVKLYFSDNEISLEKGLIFKRASVMPLSSIVKVTLRRTILMRLLRAKEITVFTLGGKMSFYLPENERLPFLPEKRFLTSTPRFRDVIFGAFIDTRALAGLFMFTAVLRRFNSIFGSEYFDRLINALKLTADELEKVLGFFRIAAPRILVTVAVFTLGAWTFAFIRKLLNLCKFSVSKNGNYIFVTSGLLTIYEYALVRNSAANKNNAAVISCDTLITCMTRRAPLYFRGVMLCPCVKHGELPNITDTLCGIKLPQNKLVSPKRAFLGHIAAPLFVFAAFAAAIAVCRAMLLRTVLYSGAMVSLYTAALYLLYMRRSGVYFGECFTAVTARRSLRLYTAVFPSDIAEQRSISQNPFQKRSGLCNVKLTITERRKFTVRHISNIF